MNNRGLAALCHLLGLVPYVGFIGILLIYLNNQFDALIAREAKKSMNFQVIVMVVLLGVFIADVLGLDTIANLAGEIVLIGEWVLVLLAGLTTYLGKDFKYPISAGLFR